MVDFADVDFIDTIDETPIIYDPFTCERDDVKPDKTTKSPLTKL